MNVENPIVSEEDDGGLTTSSSTAADASENGPATGAAVHSSRTTGPGSAPRGDRRHATIATAHNTGHGQEVRDEAQGQRKRTEEQLEPEQRQLLRSILNLAADFDLKRTKTTSEQHLEATVRDSTGAQKHDRHVSIRFDQYQYEVQKGRTTDDPSKRARRHWKAAYAYAKFVYAFKKNRRLCKQVIAHSVSQAPISTFWVGTERIYVLFADATMSIFDSLTGELRGAVRLQLDHGVEVQEGCFSDDGTVLMVALKNKTYPLYKFDTAHSMLASLIRRRTFRKAPGMPVLPLTQGPYEIGMKPRCMVVGIENQLLAIGTSKRSVQVLSVQGFRLLFVAHAPHRDEVVSVALSPRTHYLATGCKDKCARVFDLKQTEANYLIYSLKCERVYALDFSPNGRFLLVGSDDKKTRLVDPKNSVTVFTVTLHTDYVRAVRFFKNGRYFVSATKNGCVSVSDSETGEPVYTYKGYSQEHCKAVHVLQSPHDDGHPPSGHDNVQFLVGSFDSSQSDKMTTLTSFNVLGNTTPASHLSFDLFKKAIVIMAFHPTRAYLACGSASGDIQIFNVRDGEKVTVLRPHTAAVTGLDFVADGTMLLSSSLDKTVAMVCLRRYEPVKVVTVDSSVLCCTVSCRGLEAIACTKSQNVLSINLAPLSSEAFQREKRESDALLMHVPLTTRARHMHDQKYKASVKQQAEQVQALNELLTVSNTYYELESKARCIAALPVQQGYQPVGMYGLCRTLVVMGLENGVVVAFDTQLHEHRWVSEVHTKEVYSVSFSACGSFVASGSRDKACVILDARSGAPLHRLEKHTDHIRTVAFGPENQLITGGIDGNAFVFDESSQFDAHKFAVRTRRLDATIQRSSCS